MGKPKEHLKKKQVPARDEEDAATLAAIDEGLRDAKAGRTTSIGEVRKHLLKWNTERSLPKGR